MSGFASGSLVLDGRFKIERLLGRGGMGDVYLAEQTSLERKVALKVLRADLLMQPGMTQRFRREAKLLSSLEHPSIVRVIDFGDSAEAAFLIMEYVEGRPLDEALRTEAFEVERTLTLLRQIAEGLGAIHARGIVHRDLKPENVLLAREESGERARLLDFGIATLVEPDPATAGITQAGIVLGTPEYISPEQATGGAASPRSDVYAFGVLAFRALSGRLPFDGRTPQQLLVQHASAAPADLAEVAPRLAALPRLSALVMRCLSKAPEERPQVGRELVRALDEALRPIGEDLPVRTSAQPGGTAQFGAVTAEQLAASPQQGGPGAGAARVEAAPFAPTTGAAAQPANTTGGTAARTAPTTTNTGGWSRSTSGSQETLKRAQNLVLMLTDIKGFTARTSRQTREQNAKMLEEHDALLLPVTRAFGGRLIQKRGDALLVVFTSPTDAVRCGMAIQDRLWRHNQSVDPSWKLNVRVCLHLGEVVVTKDGLIGEPAQVVAQVEGEADAGEVVFTEAVRLAMTQAEIPFEPRGSLKQVGIGDELKLYRCRAQADGSPFGGLDLHASSTGSFVATLTRAAEGTSHAMGALSGLSSRLKRVPRRTWAITGTIVCGLVIVATTIAVWRQRPLPRAERFLAEGKPREALLVLEALEAPRQSRPEVRQLKATALHLLKRHRDEYGELSALSDLELGELDPSLLGNLAEDFGRNERDGALKALLARVSKESLQPALTSLAKDETSPQQWGALRYLDLSGAAGALAYGEWYAEALKSTDCRIRGAAARRLGELKDPSTVAALEALKSTPKKSGIFTDENCGQDEASAAIRAIRGRK